MSPVKVGLRAGLGGRPAPRCAYLIVVGYYGFSYLLDAGDRDACLARIAAHLAADGRAVLHLPAAALLSRAVPAHEIAALGVSIPFTDGGTGRPLTVEHVVRDMRYDRRSRIRSMDITVRLVDHAGSVLRSDDATMHYACVSEAELRDAASRAGLTVTETRTGFTEAVRSELIAVLTGKDG